MQAAISFYFTLLSSRTSIPRLGVIIPNTQTRCRNHRWKRRYRNCLHGRKCNYSRKFTARDASLQHGIHFFPSSNLGFEDVNSQLQSVSETKIIEKKLSNLFQQTYTSSISYEPNYILDIATSTLKIVFLQMLSSITNPILNFIFTVLFFLLLIWYVILTIWTLRILLPLLNFKNS